MGLDRLIKKKEAPREKSIEEVHAHVAKAAADAFAKAFPEAEGMESKREAITEIFSEFFREQVEHTELYESERYGVSYLHSAIDAGDMAKKLYAKYLGALPELQPAAAQIKSHDEFLFPSFFTPKNPGALFVFFEQGLNQLVRELPDAIEHIKRGEEPPKHIVHYVGTPTRDIAHMEPQFLADLHNDNALEVFGDMYAELIADRMQKDGAITLRGISLGAPFALNAAKRLLEDGVVTQDGKNTELPRMQVRIDTPPSVYNTQTFSKSTQVQAGFAIDGIKGIISDPMSRASASPFLGSVVEGLKPALARKGIREEMTPDQALWKKGAIKKVLADFFKGTPVPEGVKITEVIGTSDTTMFAPFSKERRRVQRAARETKETYEGSLAQHTIAESDTRRTFAADMTHMIPNITPTVLRRLHRAVSALEHMKLDRVAKGQQ